MLHQALVSKHVSFFLPLNILVKIYLLYTRRIGRPQLSLLNIFSKLGSVKNSREFKFSLSKDFGSQCHKTRKLLLTFVLYIESINQVTVMATHNHLYKPSQDLLSKHPMWDLAHAAHHTLIQSNPIQSIQIHALKYHLSNKST